MASRTGRLLSSDCWRFWCATARVGRALLVTLAAPPHLLGTGKSTAVRRAIKSRSVPKGVVYFSAPELPSDFSVDLANALGYFTPVDIIGRLHRLFTGETKAQGARVTWTALRPFIVKAVMQFGQAHEGRTPVLVLDAMDVVASELVRIYAGVAPPNQPFLHKQEMTPFFSSRYNTSVRNHPPNPIHNYHAHLPLTQT